VRSITFAVLVAVAGAGCSIFLNPAGAPDVPCDPSACVQLPNATSRCEGVTCAYSCNPGSADLDGDLLELSSNGCEGACGAATAPTELHALVGKPSGAIHWLWNPPDAGAEAYRVCTGPQLTQLSTCANVSAELACAQPKGGFACSTTTTGLTNNVRHYGRVQTVDRCANISPETAAPTRSVTPFNGEPATLADLSVESPCNARITLDGGSVRVTQTSLFCITGLLFGDDEWQDFTLHAETKILDTTRVFYSGLAFHYPSGQLRERRALVLVTNSSDLEAPAALTVLTPMTSGFDKSAATSIGPVEGNRWIGVDIVSKGSQVAVALGPADSAPSQILRWREPTGVGGRGRFALYLGTASFFEESVEFRNFTVSTHAALPADAGPTSRKLELGTSALPAAVRVTPVGSNNVKMVTCPTFPAAPGCPADGGCLPSAGTNCIEINQLGNSQHALTFDQPVGLDTTQPWRVSFKFSPTALGNNAQILRTNSGKGSVLRGGNAGSTKVSVFGVETDAGVPANTWNRFDLRFSANGYALDVNGINQPVAPLFPPADFDAHLGAFILGGQGGENGTVHGYWTDIEIAQPP
jgi:hypothetical protein